LVLGARDEAKFGDSPDWRWPSWRQKIICVF
jgi:hypothetical protein